MYPDNIFSGEHIRFMMKQMKIINTLYKVLLLNTNIVIHRLAPSAEKCQDKAESHPADYVLKEGKSKFYRKSIDDLDKITDDELDYDDPQTMNTDAISQTSVETAETLPVKDILN